MMPWLQCARRVALPLLVLLMGAGLAAAPVTAAEKHQADEAHGGVVAMPPYDIFPENRFGNAVYVDKRLVLTRPNLAVEDIAPLDDAGHFAYLASTRQGQRIVDVYVGEGQSEPRVTEVLPRFYYAVMVLEGVVTKKLYRVNPAGGGIQDLLSYSRTADGVTPGADYLAFYHVADARTDDQGRQDFGMRIHVVPLQGSPPVRSLPELIYSPDASLALEWVDEANLRYTREDGHTDILSVSDFR